MAVCFDKLKVHPQAITKLNYNSKFKFWSEWDFGLVVSMACYIKEEKFTYNFACGHRVGVQVYESIHFFFTLAIDVGVWQTPRPGPCAPLENPNTHFYMRLGGPQGQSERVRKISPLLKFEHWTVQPVASRSSDCTACTPARYMPRVIMELSIGPQKLMTLLLFLLRWNYLHNLARLNNFVN